MPPEFQFVLSTTGISSINQGIFFGPQNIDWQSPVSSTMSMPGFSWHLYAQPDDGWPNYPASPWLLRSILALTTLTIIAGTCGLQPSSSMIVKCSAGSGGDCLTWRLSALLSTTPLTVSYCRQTPQFHTNSRIKGGGSALLLQRHLRFIWQTKKNSQHGVSSTLATHFRFSGLEGFFPIGNNAFIPIMLHGLRLDLQGNESVIWIIVEDISQRKEAERLKSEFISTVSHELRTPPSPPFPGGRCRC